MKNYTYSLGSTISTVINATLTIDSNGDDDYDLLLFTYDNEKMAKIIPAVLIYSLTFILGIIGNVLVIFTIRSYKKLHSVTNVFLLSLASADLLLIIACVPLKILEFFSYYWALGKLLCKLMHYTQNVSVFASALFLTAISLERYVAIVYPLKSIMFTKSAVKKIAIFIWLLSLLATIPILFGKSTVTLGLEDKVDICTRVWVGATWQTFEIYRAILVLILPIMIMIFTYVSIIVALWKAPAIRKNYHSEPHNEHHREEKSRSHSKDKIDGSNEHELRKQIIKMLIIVISLFFLCWGPLVINNLLTAFGYLPNENIGILWTLRMYFSVLAYFNSCVNPFVYAFMSKGFRKGFYNSIKSSVCIRRCFSSEN